jgi:hypothetical protein
MRKTGRYCLDDRALSLLRRDGIGWGHDLDCGCFQHDVIPVSGWFSRLFRRGAR